MLKANLRLSGEKAPDDSIKLYSSISSFVSLLLSRLMFPPVSASAKKRSILKRLFSERNAMYLPSGEIAGETFIRPRSEEHTSELQSLMRISYAVFCLQKKHKTIIST